MVNTRSSARKEQKEGYEQAPNKHQSEPQVSVMSQEYVKPREAASASCEPAKYMPTESARASVANSESQVPPKVLSLVAIKRTEASASAPASVVKLESAVPPKGQSVSASSRSMVSAASLEVRRKKLVLEAEKRKAEVKLNLIEKQLEADLAALEEESKKSGSSNTNRDIEEWIERSQQELSRPDAPNVGYNSGNPPPPAIAAGPEETIKMLAAAVNNLSCNASGSKPQAHLLSRLATPRDLPAYSGDPLDWLHFKRAFDESTQLCSFSDKENVWRLRKCLHGAAKEAVSALLISGTTPETIMSTLELQLGNPDVILARILSDIKKIPSVSEEYHKNIIPYSVKVKNYVTAVSVVGREEHLVATNILSCLLEKLPTVLISKWADYTYPLIKKGARPTLHTLAEFLHAEALKVSALGLMVTTSAPKTKRVESIPVKHSVLLNNEEQKACQFCHADHHKITDCRKFKKALRKDRWSFVKKHRLCYKCLESTHGRNTCPANACDMDNCGLQHHRLLHYNTKTSTTETGPVNIQKTDDQPQLQKEQQPESVIHITGDCKVLLKVVRVKLYGPKGSVNCYALLDDGSTVSLISAELTSQLGLSGKRDTMRVRGAWDDQELVCETDVVSLQLSTSDGSEYRVKVHSVKELNLPYQNLGIVNCDKFSHLKNLIPKFCNENVKPGLLLGQDNINLLMPLKCRVGKSNEPCATLTPLGWCIHGRVPVALSGRHTTLALVSDIKETEEDKRLMLQQLHDMVSESFTIESMGISGKVRLNCDEVRAVEHLSKTAVLIGGRWHVGLPWRDPHCMMPDSRPSALSRLRGVEKKITSNEGFAQRYKERIKHLLDNHFAEEVSDCDVVSSKVWYLPHFAVDNPNKKKLRLVFDAAAKANGVSLNDYLLTGPDMLNSLFGIMLRFREHRVAIVSDIKDMFLRIKILPEDQDALRFLWRSEVGKEVKTFKMTSLIFGASCSPFIAQFIRDKNAERFASTMPSAVEAIKKQHYMDDYIDSQPDDLICTELAKNVSYIHKQGGFVICNWLSNSSKVLSELPQHLLSSNAYKLQLGQQLDGERALGLIWYPSDDTLGFDVSFRRIPLDIMSGKRPTKREALQVIMSIFDVYGFLSPFTINGKIILQRTWHPSPIDWDETFNDELFEKWSKWLDMLKSIGDIRLPRCYQSLNPSVDAGKLSNNRSINDSDIYNNLELHVFSDASTQAMCAVAYLRWTDNNNLVNVAFVSSKCRVAPVKFKTVPRLELQAALMAARLANTIKKELRIKIMSRTFWCDSTTVLQWIRNNKRKYEVYVAHRLGEIDELTTVSEWRYVPTKCNVADIATRESYDPSVLHGEWFTGPKFLYMACEGWSMNIFPEAPCEKENADDIECVSIAHMVSDNLPVPDPSRFSSWLRLVRSTAAVLKFINKCKRVHVNECDLMALAENLLIRYSQRQSFGEDLAEIRKGKSLSKSSRLLSLSPVLDDDDILRVCGRIDAALDIPLDVKQPVILDGKSHISRLIVNHYHVRAAHANQETVVNELKQRYWILKLRPTVKYVTSKCFYVE